jgi:F-type H+-transporting ATPase subunit a
VSTATAGTQVLADGGCHLFSGCAFPAPSLDNFQFRSIFRIGGWGFDKPQLLALICSGLVVWFFWRAFRRPQMVPRGLQNIAEIGYLFVRDQIARSMLGKKADAYMPFLVSLFFFVWLMNLMAIIPIAEFPAMSLIGFPLSIALMVYFTYWYQAIKRHGFFGFLKSTVPSGVPIGILPILAPVEWLRVIIIQPFTLTIRLFANMFSGHMLLATFVAATWYLVGASIGLVYSAGSLALVIALTAFELLIQFLQAYIFTLLTAQYISESLESGH